MKGDGQPRERRVVFSGDFPLTLDNKNRLLIPAEVRRRLGTDSESRALYLVIGTNLKLWFWPESYYERILDREAEALTPEQELYPADDTLDRWARTFGMGQVVEWDKQGRLLVPQSLLEDTHTGTDVTLIGFRNHLQLWNRDEWKAHSRKLLTADRQAKQAGTPGNTSSDTAPT